MRKVRFAVEPRADLGGVLEVAPAIDEIAFTDLVYAFELESGMETTRTHYGGLIPAHFDFGPLDMHFLGSPASGTQARSPLLGCSCGEWGCWPFLARIVATPQTVTWSDFEQPYRRERDYSGFGSFTFDRVQYDRALVALSSALAGATP